MTGGAPPSEAILCLVTDRRRASPGSDFRTAAAALVEQARWAADAGIDWLQIRERDLEAAPLCALAAEIVEVTRGSATRVVVNDRVDIAIAANAAGVHLRGDSVPCTAVRAIAPAPFAIGRSVHGPEEARTAGSGADYLIAGTTFGTRSKPDRTELLGVDGLRAIVTTVPQPVLAIGGITLDRIADVARCGAAGIAAIGLFLGERGPRCLDAIVDQIRQQFGAGAGLPSGTDRAG